MTLQTSALVIVGGTALGLVLGIARSGRAAVPRHAARKSALRHLANTFFDGSAEQVVAAVLGGEAARLTDADLDRIARLVAKARKEGAK